MSSYVDSLNVVVDKAIAVKVKELCSKCSSGLKRDYTKTYKYDVYSHAPTAADKVIPEKLSNGKVVYHCTVCLN